MMKHNIHFFFVATLIICSCRGEALQPRDYTQPPGNRVAVTLSANLPDGSSMLWDNSAIIGIFGNSTAVNVPCSIAASTAGTESGLFYSSLNWDDIGDNIYIYYPYSEANTSTILSGNLPQTYSHQNLSALNKSNIMCASVSRVKSSAAGPVQAALRPVLAIRSLILSSDTYAGWDLDAVSIKAKSGEVLAGEYSYDITNGSFSFGTVTSDSIAVALAGEKMTSEGSQIWWLASESSTLIDADVEAILSKEGENNVALKGNITLADETSASIDGFTAQTQEDTSIDLSCPDGEKVETANCYVASAAGATYKFPATVMGNGAYLAPWPDYISPKGGTANGITPKSLNPASAAILWQTEKSLIGNVKLKNGYVYFTLNGNPGGTLMPGNAVIAVWSGPDATGTILWSWHIWVTDADIETKLQTWKVHTDYTSYSSYANPILMDRNLGAITADDYSVAGSNGAIGLNYQWGRKDPFPGPDNSSYDSKIALKTYDASDNEIPAMVTATNFSNAVKWTAVASKLSLSDIAAYPMAFVNGATNYFWLEDSADDLWGCPALADNSNDIGVKTIYDPCPPGYRVMNIYAMTGVTSNAAGGKLDNYANTVQNRTSYRDDQAQLQVLCDGTSVVAKLPASGLMFFEKTQIIDRVGGYGHLWSAKKSSTHIDRAMRMHYDWNNFVSMEASYGSYGHNVRCEKIR